MEPNLLSYGITSAAAAGPVGVLLMIAVIYFARRDAKRDDRERDDRVQLATAMAQNTAALIEFRKAAEESKEALESVRLELARRPQ